jgi:hypothetical protein
MTTAWKHDVEEAEFASAGKTPLAVSPTAHLHLHSSDFGCEPARASYLPSQLPWEENPTTTISSALY